MEGTLKSYLNLGWIVKSKTLLRLSTLKVLDNDTHGSSLGGKFIFASNISSLIKGWSQITIFGVGKEETFVPFINAELGDHFCLIYCCVHQIIPMNNI